MASYKFNYLHLHLTDDQVWRIQIKKYGKLTIIGSKRKETDGNGKQHKGYYTQKQLKKLVAYAKTKHVEIIPEIDMPGHRMSVLAAYPKLACFPRDFEVRITPSVSKELLCAGKKEVYEFYEDVISQVASIFPNSQIHLGGDEAPLYQWRKCPNCQETMYDLGLKNEEKLMSYFLDRINKMLLKQNKSSILWYENSVKSYPENSTLVLCRNERPDKRMHEIKSRGFNMINCYGRNTYFNYPQWSTDVPYADWMSILTLKKAYQFDPVRGLSEKDSEFIIGIEGCLWGEYIPNIDRAFYMTYPRALALSEAAWSTENNRSWGRFKTKLTSI